MIKDDRAAKQQIDPDFSDAGLGDDLREFLAKPADGDGKSTTKSVRGKRELRATFRAAPGERAGGGLHGTRAFSSASRRLDTRAAGSDIQSAPVGPVGSPAPAPRADDAAGRGASVPPGGSAAPAVGAIVSAAEGTAGGRVRGRRSGSVAGSGKTGKKPAKTSRSALPYAIKKLVAGTDESTAPTSSGPRLVPTESERANATRLFRQIGETFNENRKKSKTAAYAGYRHDLMANLDTLVMGGALDLKDATTIITNLEQFTKETEAESTETPATILGRWLRMSPEEIAELEVKAEDEPVEESVEEDSGEEVGADDEPVV